MYNLMLVEDEPILLEGLYSHIDWESAGFSQVFCASDGMEALRVIEAEHVDIVISDIRMPGLDGLALCDRLHQKWPLTKVIFLSGYSEFDYARKAVEVSAYQYLLKPIKYEELKRIAMEALRALQNDLTARKAQDEARRIMAEAQNLMQERYLRDWLVLGLADPLSCPEEAEQCGVRFPECLCQLLLLRMDDRENSMPSLLDQVTLETLARKLLAPTQDVVGLDIDGRYYLLLFRFDSDAENSLSRNLAPFQERVADAMALDVSLFLHEQVRTQLLHAAYQRLSARAMLPDVRGRMAIVEVNEQDDVLCGQVPDNTLSSNADSAMNLVRRQLERAHDKPGILQSIYRSLLCLTLSEGLRRSLRMDTIYRLIQSDNVERVQTREQCLACCLEIVRLYFDSLEHAQQNGRHDLMRQVNRLVCEHAACATVSWVAQVMHYNPSYLSRIVKEESGLSMVDYITDHRMRIAKELLSSGKSVTESARMAGYESVPYFTRLFKRIMGINPSQYKG